MGKYAFLMEQYDRAMKGLADAYARRKLWEERYHHTHTEEDHHMFFLTKDNERWEAHRVMKLGESIDNYIKESGRFSAFNKKGEKV